ncbi:MAG TPA: S-methyl-5-thioribose-1-phosphate isomerase [Clostridiaceae bacterium]|nr:S-methyl-5-thioribose-1-phosphate isomerase [Clostridiaceae bacterium]
MKPVNVQFRDDYRAVILQDQTVLPRETRFIELKTPEAMHEAIFSLRVRGAPAIGIAAAFSYAVTANRLDVADTGALKEALTAFADYLNSSRPTAVNLSWALNRMEAVTAVNLALTLNELRQRLIREAIAIQEEDVDMCRRIAENGLTLLQENDGVLTHCNAGPLATSLYGTALGPVLLANDRGMKVRVFADETRPLLQGARITSYELDRAGVDVTLICDNMAATVMKNGWIDACFVGCDRIAANGDVANKIGTNGVAILARHYNIPFYVLGPTSTIDFETATGDDIEIELRDPEEIRSKWYAEPQAPASVKCYNPAFDVTNHDLIAGIVTEHGILRAPYADSIEALRRTLFDKTTD